MKDSGVSTLDVNSLFHLQRAHKNLKNPRDVHYKNCSKWQWAWEDIGIAGMVQELR